MITAAPSSLQMAIGDSAAVVAIVSGGKVGEGHAVTWSSSDTTVIILRPATSDTALVTRRIVAVRAGRAEIIVSAENVNASIQVTVLPMTISPVLGTVYRREGGLGLSGATVTARSFTGPACTGTEGARKTFTTAADGSFAGRLAVPSAPTPGWDCVELAVEPPAGSGLAPETHPLLFGGDVVFPSFTWGLALALQPAAAPEPPGGTRTWSAVTAGTWHTCALGSDGAIACWGSNAYGQLGTGAPDNCWTPASSTTGRKVGCAAAPASLPSLLPTKSLSASAGQVTCALAEDGPLSCWGDSKASMPVVVVTPGVFTAFDGSCGLKSTGKAYCFLRSATIGGAADTVPGLPALATIASNGNVGCGTTSAGAGWCWGNSYWAQLGGGGPERTPSGTAVRVATDAPLALVRVGGSFTCALGTDGAPWCWGIDDRGQLGGAPGTRQICGLYVGRGGAPPCALAPVQIPGFSFDRLATGGSHACALTSGGEAWCWGDNRGGQLGIGTADTLAHAGPVKVAGGLRFRAITAGLNHTCAIAESGGLYCWGDNQYGQLGVGSMADRARPTRVSGSAP